MKKQVYISGKMIFSILFEIIGIAVLIFGIMSTRNYDAAMPVSSPADIEGKQFVKIIINEYMVKPKSEVNPEFSVGVCQKYTGLFGKEYNTYNVKLDSGDYLRTQVANADNLIKLDSYEKGVGDGIEITGRVMKQKNIDMSWYQGVEGFDPNDLIMDKCIRETGRDLYKNSIYIGAYLAAVALYGIISEALYIHNLNKVEDQ